MNWKSKNDDGTENFLFAASLKGVYSEIRNM